MGLELEREEPINIITDDPTVFAQTALEMANDEGRSLTCQFGVQPVKVSPEMSEQDVKNKLGFDAPGM